MTVASGWPWMKNEAFALVDEPVPPTSDQDERPAIRDLIELNHEKIEKVKDQLSEHPLYEPTKHDDLWILRFLLSHKKSVNSASKAAKHTLVFRKENGLDDLDIRSIHIGHDMEGPNQGANNYQRCCDPSTFRFVVHDRCVVSYIQFAGFDQPRLLKELHPDHWQSAFAFITEWSHQWSDYLTRTTGRLTKTIRLFDLANICLKKNGNLIAINRDGNALNAMEDCYPQLLQALYLVDAPIWVEAPWKMIKPMVPKRVLEKFDFLDPAKKEKHLKKLTKFIDIDKLPSRLGGKLKSWPDDTPPPSRRQEVQQ